MRRRFIPLRRSSRMSPSVEGSGSEKPVANAFFALLYEFECEKPRETILQLAKSADVSKKNAVEHAPEAKRTAAALFFVRRVA